MTIDSPRSSLQGTAFVRSRLLSAEDRQALEEIATAPRSFKAGVDLVFEGVRTDTIFVVTEGWACRSKMTRAGGRQITGLVVPGEVCNLVSFVLSQVNYGVRMLTAGTAVGLPPEHVQALAAERPAIARAFTWSTIAENAVLNEWALSLGRQTARERLAHLLCELAVRLDGTEGDEASYELPATQEQLADALGLTSVHVNRTLQQLRVDGLVAIEARRVTLPNVEALRRVGGFDDAYLHANRSENEARARRPN
jgi:CRP-like cAMP-binding protein